MWFTEQYQNLGWLFYVVELSCIILAWSILVRILTSCVLAIRKIGRRTTEMLRARFYPCLWFVRSFRLCGVEEVCWCDEMSFGNGSMCAYNGNIICACLNDERQSSIFDGWPRRGHKKSELNNMKKKIQSNFNTLTERTVFFSMNKKYIYTLSGQRIYSYEFVTLLLASLT